MFRDFFGNNVAQNSGGAIEGYSGNCQEQPPFELNVALC